ncbi:MAG: DsbA family protein [Deltaproteobacteria bacterium]|nr:DsbA family protein [Deltaproteobacteria bacterium]
MQVDVWFDFSCPYAYLASERIEAIAAAAGARVVWQPMLLGGVFRATRSDDGPMATLGPAKAAHNARDMHRWAEVLGVPLAIPPAHPMRTVRALRVLLGLPEAAWPPVIHSIYAAYWQRGEDITRDEVIDRALASAGIEDEVRSSAFAGADTDAIKDELRARTDRAIGLGVFGAPAMIVRRDGAPPALFWGQDRLDQVAAALAGWDPDHAAPPGGPRSAAEGLVAAASPTTPTTIDFWFDLASPFAYLGATQIEQVAAAAGARVHWRPILLGGLFRAIGTPDVPLFAMPEAKRRYAGGELDRFARWWGVPFTFPTRFPMRTVAAQRVLAAAPDDVRGALARALFRAYWVEDRDISRADVIAEVCAAAGHAALAARADDPAAKQALIDETSAAQQAGVFGVPTCTIPTDGAPLLFWGQDRLALAGRAAAGWRPRAR